MWELLLLLAVSILAAWPLGHYMAGIFDGRSHPGDRIFEPVERLVYRILGIDPGKGMDWRTYTRAFLFSNVAFGAVAFGLLSAQHRLPLNPDRIGPLSWDLALHTAISFLTNTNQQHYAGQAQLTYLSQSLVIVTLQFVSPAMALAVCAALLRAMAGGRYRVGRNRETAREGEARDLGNYYVDVVRSIVRLLLPLSLLLALFLAWQGIPGSYSGSRVSTMLDPMAEPGERSLPVGPVAAMVAIKQLGSNGGGWYGSNSANPLENPTPLSNAAETMAILLLPVATLFMAGALLRRRGFAVMSFAAMGLIGTVCIAAMVLSERAPNAAFSGLCAPGPNMEGKEVRFGPDLSALWAALTTQTSNGSVNTMHDSLNPVGGLVARAGMLVNAVWGGVGCGFVNFMVYVWTTVFLSGLMIGRTPEIFGRKLEVREITLLGILMVLQPLCVLGFTAISVAFPSLAANSNPGFHGISQVFYEYASAFANNGSGLEGLGDNTLWWNLSCSVCLVLGRYLSLVLPLAIGGTMAAKRQSPETAGSLKLESPTFCLTLVSVMLILNFLSFLPSTVLGPVGEALQQARP